MDISINVPKTSEINISGNTKEIRVPDKSVTYAKLADDVTLILSEKADKASTDSALEQKADKTSVDAEISEVNVALERIKYYGSADVVPSDESYFTVNSTGETITGLTDTGKTQTELVIPYKINGVKITTLFSGSDGIDGPPVSILDGNSTITKVVIPKSVTTLGGAAFYGRSSLASINIPNGVTSIEKHAFDSCTSLTSINLPNSVTSIVTLAFNNCTSLASITIPNSITSIELGAFAGCTNLKIYCEQGSYAETCAKDDNIPIVYTDISSAELDKKANDEDVIKQVNEGKQIKLILDSESLTNVVLTPTELYFDNIGSGISGRFSAKEAKIRASDGEHFLSKKANTADVLSKTNTIEFTPTADYHPATKKYVDDLISVAISAYDAEVMALLGGDAE